MKKEKIIKTNAMRILDKHKISYEVISHEVDEHKVGGIDIALKIGEDARIVCKTLALMDNNNKVYICVLSSVDSIDMKKLAKYLKVKKIDMLDLSKLYEFTGYVRGACTPIGMKKTYRTIFEKSIVEHKFVLISAGDLGLKLKIKVDDLLNLLNPDMVQIKEEN